MFLKKLVFYTDKQGLTIKGLSDKNYDLPRINDKFIGKKKNYFYSVWFNPTLQHGYGITKYDIKNNTVLNWVLENNFPGEPIFIAKPNSSKEDEGIVLSLVYYKEQNKNYLLILEATTMKQLAQIFVDDRIPLGVHGRFFVPVVK